MEHVGLGWTQGLGVKGIVYARPSYVDFPQRLKKEKPGMRGGADRVLNALGLLYNYIFKVPLQSKICFSSHYMFVYTFIAGNLNCLFVH